MNLDLNNTPHCSHHHQNPSSTKDKPNQNSPAQLGRKERKIVADSARKEERSWRRQTKKKTFIRLEEKAEMIAKVCQKLPRAVEAEVGEDAQF